MRRFRVTWREQGADTNRSFEVWGYSIGDVVSGLYGLGQPERPPQEITDFRVGVVFDDSVRSSDGPDSVGIAFE